MVHPIIEKAHHVADSGIDRSELKINLFGDLWPFPVGIIGPRTRENMPTSGHLGVGMNALDATAGRHLFGGSTLGVARRPTEAYSPLLVRREVRSVNTSALYAKSDP